MCLDVVFCYLGLSVCLRLFNGCGMWYLCCLLELLSCCGFTGFRLILCVGFFGCLMLMFCVRLDVLIYVC